MELKKEEFKSSVFGAEKEMEFSVDTSSSVIFDILRDKMYTNKIAAVCREVSSNSRDANIENGKPDVPITIDLVEPFELDCISDKSIVFGDSGIGITPDRMADVFIKYAASTKRSGNEQVGGFGLGAKTPFAYSDTFTVITVCDVEDKRWEYTYTAMIDSTQRGKMIQLDSEEVSNSVSTGTRIIVPFNDNDRYNFEKEVHRATCLWDTRPELKGFSYTFGDLETLIEDRDLRVLVDKEEFFYSTYLVIIEGIPYKLDTGLFSDKFGDILKYGLGESTPIALYFKTGEVEISANREGIHYTESTKQVIEDKLILVEEKLRELTKDYYTGSSYIEGCIRISELTS